jgi:predicted MarR family transcription regulator
MKELEFYLWAHVLMYIHKHKDDDYSSMNICKELSISTTATVSKLTQLLEKKGMIRVAREGRKNTYIVTKDGEVVADRLKDILHILRKK